MQIDTCFPDAVLLWRSVVVFGSVLHCNALGKLRLFCNGSHTTGEWKNHYMIQATGGTALSRFFCYI
jgi:hypothetical protein